MRGLVGVFVGVMQRLDPEELLAQGGKGDVKWAGGRRAEGEGRGEECVVVCYI
jgi:hypothetical protein